MTHPRSAAPAVPTLSTSSPANGRHTTAPTAHAVQVTWMAERRATTDFWTTRLTAYDAADIRHSATPHTSLFLSPDVEVAIRTTPVKATIRPTPRATVGRSLRNTAASTATSTGESWMSIAAVPASTRRSPALSATL